MRPEAYDYDEVWGYTYEQIREYLLHRGAKEAGDAVEGIFYMDRCRIILERRPEQQIGSLSFPKTRMCMEGPGAETFHHQFLLNFLTGGG